MPELLSDSYARHFLPGEYLRQYYSGALAEDDAANTRFAARELRRLGRRYERALEFGCGPTLHHAFPLVPFARHIELADLLERNLDEVRSWRAAAPRAFDWDPWLRAMLAVEAEVDPAAVLEGFESRKRRLRSALGPLSRCDLRADPPLRAEQPYDLVASYYCVECVARDHGEWSAALGRLAALLRPGGVLLLGAMRRAVRYRVMGVEFPAVPVDEGDFARCLPDLGFPESGTRIELAQVDEYADLGFDSVCCVLAVRGE
jgi:hypothetical protein